MIKSFLLILLCCASLLSAYDINSTLVEGNTKVYQNLLDRIDKEDTLSSEQLLEKSLLKILVADTKKALPHAMNKIVLPKNSDGYKRIFGQYLNLLRHAGQIQTQLSQNKTKIATIEKKIQKLDKNSTKALSLELQDALYHKNIALYTIQIRSYQEEKKKSEQALIDSLKYIFIDEVDVQNNIAQYQMDQQKIDNEINGLEINKEQANLIGNSNESSIFKHAIRALKSKKQALIEDLAASQFLLFASALQHKKKIAFSWEKQILNKIQALDTLSSVNRDTLALLLHRMENTYLGTLQTITGSGKEEIKTLGYQVWAFISTPVFTLNQTPISIFKLAMTLLIFIMGFIIGALYKRRIKNMTLSRRSFTTSTRTLLANIGYYLIIVIAFFIALNVLGVKLSSLAVVAGALSVGIGFGLQNVVSNFVSGLILMIERSIKIGDYIQLDDDLRGYVSDIRMRSTTVVTNENIDVIIPNQKLIENNVINWTMSDNIRRFSIPFGVAYGTDVHKVIDLVTKTVLQSTLREDIVENKQRKTSVIMTEMADSSVNFELFVWVKADELQHPKQTASSFLILIYDALYEHGIEIPFPQQDIHIRSVEDSFVVKSVESEKA